MDTSDNQNKEQAPVFNNPAISQSKQVSQRDGETVPSGNSRKKMIVVTASIFWRLNYCYWRTGLAPLHYWEVY